MENKILNKTRLSKKISNQSVVTTFYLVMSILLLTFLNFHFENLTASPKNIFEQHQYCKLWTTLFAHADLEHLGGNLLLFIPFSIYLSNYYGKIFFPLIGILLGGLINYIVLLNMPLNTSLLGISGVVHWMGFSWITLFFLIDKRLKTGPRFIKAFGVLLILFVPNVLHANISYLSHFLGAVFGVISALVYYFINKEQLKSEEEYIFEYHYYDDSIYSPENFEEI